jgi:ribosomal protein S18 acetylase RimI-like enzyme
MTVTVRIAVLPDLDLVAALFDGYRRFYGRSADEAGARAFLRDRITGEESTIFLAEEDGGAVGFAQLYPGFTSTGMARIWILNDLFVLPGYRQKGIAGSLLETAAAFARQTGAARLSLSTAVTNLAAQALYERHGWKKDAEFLHYNLVML